MTIDEITTAHLKEIINRCIKSCNMKHDSAIEISQSGTISPTRYDKHNEFFEIKLEQLNENYHKCVKHEKDKRHETYLKLKQEFEPNSEAMNILTNSQFGAYVQIGTESGSQIKFFQNSDTTTIPEIRLYTGNSIIDDMINSTKL